MNDADQAELEIQNRIAIGEHRARQQSQKKDRDIEPIGECHFCEEEFEENSPKLYCNNICADRHHDQIKWNR